ncbi:MAG: hypothetical protein KA175_16900 [Flavobacteriales bacterium]|nr:hypothetical protein [Flavobacteriales bacterium]MBP6699301.1 hypothetical protein [Flavobacteriales bacterium]
MAILPAVNATTPSSFVLLQLRWLQLRRALPAYGIVLLAMAMVGAVWLLRKAILHDATLAPYIAGSAVLMIWGMHQRRPDHHFVQRHVPQARSAMALEYGALILPVLLGLLFAGAWTAAAVSLVVFAFPWSPVARSSGMRAAWLRKWIPAHLFEWRSLLQGTYPWILMLWLAALAFCWLPVLPLFLLGGIALMACGAQEHCEPRAMLLATSTDASTLLRSKVLGALRLMVLVELPVIIGATVFQPDWWWIHLLFGVGMLVLVAYAVVLKYANYRPSERLDANSANVGVAAVFAILPGLGVVPLIMLLSEVRKARENLNSYFHAHHR